MNVETAALENGRSWLLRPVRAGMCHYESLRDGTLDLIDLALMNDDLDAAAENEWRIAKAMRDGIH